MATNPKLLDHYVISSIIEDHDLCLVWRVGWNGVLLNPADRVMQGAMVRVARKLAMAVSRRAVLEVTNKAYEVLTFHVLEAAAEHAERRPIDPRAVARLRGIWMSGRRSITTK